LHNALTELGVSSEIIEDSGQCGGGTLPDMVIPSYAVRLLSPERTKGKGKTREERAFEGLMNGVRPVVGILREGRILFDVLTVRNDEIPVLAREIAQVMSHV
jgi:L-seryl-tRNA(Ser) seleniumtransferase